MTIKYQKELIRKSCLLIEKSGSFFSQSKDTDRLDHLLPPGFLFAF